MGTDSNEWILTTASSRPRSMRTVSFYSYKGGTGRTLLVANIGVLAARLGMQVVMIDLDLEAPGLPYKFLPEPPDRPGVLEWLTAPRRPTLDELTEPIALSSPFRPGGSLTLISAGARPSREYIKAMRQLQEGPLAGDAEDATTSLLMLRETVMQQLNPDLLLLDARTGITTTNAITTRVLADDVVALTLNTHEQLDGTRAVLRSLVPLKKPGEDTPLGLYIVVSRVPGKPPDAGPYEWTEDERAAIGQVSDFLTEPAVPLPTTLTDPRVLLLHNDTDVAASEQILLARNNGLESTTLHVDYLRVAYALLAGLDPLIDQAMSATEDEAQRRDWATFFARTDLIVQTRPARPEPQTPPLEPGEEATPAERVRILRRLARDDATRSPDLAAALEMLAKARHDAGEHDEAIATVVEAVDQYRPLSEGSAPYQRRYVMALNTLSSYYSDAGRDREALDVAKQATEEVISMRKGQRVEDLPLVGTTLAALGLRYGDADDYGSGLAPLEDAAKIFRDLNAADPPGAYRAQLASALNVLGMLNARVGFTNEAVAAAVESVRILRSLAREDAQRYQAELAGALNNLGIHRRMTGQFSQAAAALEEALSTHRQSAYTDPDRYLADLASTQENLAAVYGDMGLASRALTAAEEALHFRRELYEADPHRYRLQLVSTLNSASAQYGALERHQEAAARAEEAVGLLRTSDRQNRSAKELLAAALNNLALSHVRLDRVQDARPPAEEALEIYESIALPGSHWDQGEIARTLLNLSLIYSLADRDNDAARSADRAVAIYRRLADSDLPTRRYTDAHANALIALSMRQTSSGDFSAATAAANEALSIYRGLAGVDPDRYRPRAAAALEALAAGLDGANDTEAARAAREQAQEILKAAVRHPELDG